MSSKKSKEQYIEEANIKHNNKYDYSLINDLPKRDFRVDIICRIHGIFNQSFHKHLCGDGCKKCAHERLGKERIEKAKQKFVDEANKIHNDKYDYSKSIYLSATDNIIIICKNHGEFQQTPNTHLNGGGCKKCSIENTRIRMSITWETYKEQLQNLHNNEYDYSKVIWNGSDNEITVICNIHGDFIIRAQYHKNGRGCQKCSKENKIQYNKHNKDIFIENAIQKWGNKFDYSKVDYIDSNNKVIVICKKHGEIEIFPPNHLNYGCGACGRETNKRNIELKEKCKTEFISKANNIHKNIYDYSSSEYQDAITKVIVICKKHGEFKITPNNHLRGRGCPDCGLEASKISKLKSLEEYQPEFIKLYGDKYDYSSVVWEGGSKPITVICKKHGEFHILPYLHKIGKECQKCSNRYSGISIDWLLFMEKRHLTEIQHARNLGEFVIPDTRYKADGYIKSSNTIFEFHGDFWHGNPELYDETDINSRVGITYGELYNQTIAKSKLIVEKGFNLIEVWENDWKKFIKSIKIIQGKWLSRSQ
uniref:Uncharacterized protein n=1 Tax=viral metagenome TaxID=1070528 RepID=A0A6C0D5K7_9ZZZZ